MRSTGEVMGIARDFPTALEQREGRDAAYAVPGGQFLRLFGVELGNPHCRFELPGRLFVGWRHRPAGPAPGRPEIDQDREIAASDLFFETGGVEFRRFSAKHRLAAFTAVRMHAEACGRNAVDGIAGRTDNM